MVLAVGSAFLGLVLATVAPISTWLEPVLGHVEHHEPVLPVPVIMAGTLLVVAVGAVWAWLVYGRGEVPQVAPEGSALTRAARRDLYQDEANEVLLQWPGIGLTRGLVSVDADGVDGAGVGGLSRSVQRSSAWLRRSQNGYARSYALTMLSGVVVFLAAMWVMN
jgi:NADH-quinone oxidoreductase subunit L